MAAKRQTLHDAGGNTDMTNKDIMEKLQDFISRYERDMRGDMNCGNGEKGLVGEIRTIKEYMRDYPTLGYLFKKNPLKIIGVGLGIFVLTSVIYDAGIIGTGLLTTILKLFGI